MKPKFQHIDCPIEKLQPYKLNNRKHPERQIKTLRNAIKEFDFNQPVLIDENFEIIAGHGRLLAAKELGLKTLPCYQYTNLTDVQKRKLRIVDNESASQAERDLENLMIELDFLEAEGVALEDYGLEDLKTLLPDEDPEVSEDDFDGECPAETFIKTGDIIELGRHRVMCGDSTSAEDVKELMDGETAELLFTSPPYSDLRTYDGSDLEIDSLAQVFNRFLNVAAYFAINLGLKFKDGAVVPYWDAWTSAANQAGLKMLAWNVWDRNQAGSVAHATNMFTITHEWIFVFGQDKKRLNRTVPNQMEEYKKRHGENVLDGTSRTVRQADGSMSRTTSKTYIKHQLHSVLNCNAEKGVVRKSHPAVFPVKFPAAYIEAITNQGDIVSDPFLGSGTTLIACEQLNRTCYGMEISPAYCHVIMERYIKFCKDNNKEADVKINGERYDHTKAVAA